MQQVKVSVEGMSCGMCEAHVNDSVRRLYPGAKNIRSSRKKKLTTFIFDGPVDESEVRTAIEGAGYIVTGMRIEPYVKHGLFGK